RAVDPAAVDRPGPARDVVVVGAAPAELEPLARRPEREREAVPGRRALDLQAGGIDDQVLQLESLEPRPGVEGGAHLARPGKTHPGAAHPDPAVEGERRALELAAAPGPAGGQPELAGAGDAALEALVEKPRLAGIHGPAQAFGGVDRAVRREPIAAQREIRIQLRH